jgi:hypothetical protein
VPVLVLGMHRSGTSVLTRVVSLLGLDVGDDDGLMAANEANATGYWEVTRLTELNDELLAQLGGRWSGPSAASLDEQVELALGEWGQRARALVSATFGGLEHWVWKDPRVCLLLPFWREVLGDDDLAVVVALREPVEVARSLEARDGIGVPYGLALWERHQRLVLAGIEGLPALVTHYDRLLAEPVAAATALHGFLPGERPGPPTPAQVGEVVDARHRHHRDPDRSGLSADASRLLEVSESVIGEHGAFGRVDPGPETPGLQLAFDEHARMAAYADLSLQYRPLVDEALASRDRIVRLEHQVELLESLRAVRWWRAAARCPRPPIDDLPLPPDNDGTEH